MNDSQFDKVSKFFGERRISRRRVLAEGGAGLAAGSLAATQLNAASAQEATPVAPTDLSFESTLFVQSFQSGSVAPKDGEDGTYTLTLEHGLGQTIYFADRPERTVGAEPTQKFLDGLGFGPDNPPNAALLVEPAPGETDIAVLELFNPRYDEATHTATYDVQILKDYEQAIGVSFAEEPADLSQMQSSFGAAHLFIDGCADTDVTCWSLTTDGKVGVFPTQPFCFWVWWGCIPCAGNWITHDQILAYWTNHCNEHFTDCGNNCEADWVYSRGT